MTPSDEATTRDLLVSHQALVEEVRALRRHADEYRARQVRLLRRMPWVLAASLLPLCVLSAVLFFALRLFEPDSAEDPWTRRQREQAERVDRLIDRAEALAAKWEKADPK